MHKHIVGGHSNFVPEDANKLRISGPCLEALATKLSIPSAFIFAISRHYLPNGRGTRKLQLHGSTVFDSWYLLPVRVQVKSGISPRAVSGNDKGPNQMDPFNKIHLPDIDIDVHRSCIGVFCRTEPRSGRAIHVAVDFMHGGRGPKVALEPKERIEAVLRQKSSANKTLGLGSFTHLVYLSSAARWWTNALHSINKQLIVYESKLQTELDNAQATAEALLQNINRGLHSIAAHLHRYQSELKSLERIVVDLSTHYDCMKCGDTSEEKGDMESENDTRSFGQILSQVEACYDFATELEKKAQNILALVRRRLSPDVFITLWEVETHVKPLSAVQPHTNQQR